MQKHNIKFHAVQFNFVCIFYSSVENIRFWKKSVGILLTFQILQEVN